MLYYTVVFLLITIERTNDSQATKNPQTMSVELCLQQIIFICIIQHLKNHTSMAPELSKINVGDNVYLEIENCIFGNYSNNSALYLTDNSALMIAVRLFKFRHLLSTCKHKDLQFGI